MSENYETCISQRGEVECEVLVLGNQESHKDILMFNYHYHFKKNNLFFSFITGIVLTSTPLIYITLIHKYLNQFLV